MISNNESICPKCGGQSKYYDSVKRIVRTKYGVKNKIDIKRFRCRRCDSVHRELPDCVIPYKQYEADMTHGYIYLNKIHELFGIKWNPYDENICWVFERDGELEISIIYNEKLGERIYIDILHNS